MIREAANEADYRAFGELIRDYVAWCRERYKSHQWLVDMAFGHQSLDAELTDLAHKYGPPAGWTLLAFEDGMVAGGVACHGLSKDICEMKRLYVRDGYAGRGIGRRLCRELVAGAIARGFSTMRLDTSRDMHEAIALYTSEGFVPCAPYIDYPKRLKPMILFMERPLRARGEFHVRPLGDGEMAVVADLSLRIWPVAYAGVLTPVQIDNLLLRIYSLENLAHEVADGHRFWLAERDGRALGFASGYREGRTIWLKKLYVLAECQGQGVGRALMDAVIAAFEPADDVRLYVNKGNLAAQRFYERSGFVRAAEVPVQMGDFAFIDYIYARPIRPQSP